MAEDNTIPEVVGVGATALFEKSDERRLLESAVFSMSVGDVLSYEYLHEVSGIPADERRRLQAFMRSIYESAAPKGIHILTIKNLGYKRCTAGEAVSGKESMYMSKSDRSAFRAQKTGRGVSLEIDTLTRSERDEHNSNMLAANIVRQENRSRRRVQRLLQSGDTLSRREFIPAKFLPE